MKYSMTVTIVTDAESPSEAKERFVEAQDLLLHGAAARIYGISDQDAQVHEGDD